MAGTAARLDVILSAQTGQFTKGLTSAASSLKTFVGTITGLGPALAGFAAGAAVFTVLKRSAAEMDDLSKSAERLGVQVGSLQTLSRQAELAGVGFGELDSLLNKFQRTLGEAALKGGEAADLLRQLGMSADELSHMSLVDAFQRVSAAINDLSGEADKAVATTTLFGRSGQQLLNLIKDGQQGFDRAANDIERFGRALDGVETKSIEEMNDSFTRSWQAVQDLGNTILISLAPVLQQMNELFQSLAENIKDVVTQFGDLDKRAKGLTDFNVGVNRAILGLLDAITFKQFDLKKKFNEIVAENERAVLKVPEAPKAAGAGVKELAPRSSETNGGQTGFWTNLYNFGFLRQKREQLNIFANRLQAPWAFKLAETLEQVRDRMREILQMREEKSPLGQLLFDAEKLQKIFDAGGLTLAQRGVQAAKLRRGLESELPSEQRFAEFMQLGSSAAVEFSQKSDRARESQRTLSDLLKEAKEQNRILQRIAEKDALELRFADL